MKNGAYQHKIRLTSLLVVTLGLASIESILGLAQNADRSSAKPAPAVPVAKTAPDSSGRRPVPSVTNKEAVAASSLNDWGQGDLRHVRSPPAMTNAPAASNGGMDRQQRLDVSKSEIHFSDIRSKMLNMPDEEFAAYAKTLTGRRVVWEGWISNIGKQAGGSVACSVDVEDPATATAHNDVILEDPAMETRGPGVLAKMLFSGRIGHVEKNIEGLHVTLFDVEF